MHQPGVREGRRVFVDADIPVLEHRPLALRDRHDIRPVGGQAGIDQDVADIEHVEGRRVDPARAELGQVVIDRLPVHRRDVFDVAVELGRVVALRVVEVEEDRASVDQDRLDLRLGSAGHVGHPLVRVAREPTPP